jgi:LuxR family maltose regulon positive regulatory protein
MLASYLDTKIWKPWDRETKTLLLRLAVPAKITPTLTERLTGRTDGRGLLEGLVKKGNAFLSFESADTYRFHDLFRDFLLNRMDAFLGRDEIRKLNDLAAGWHYEQGDYYAGAKHYIHNNDHEGIRRCLEATTRFHTETGAISMETRLNFVKQYVLGLSPEFIGQNSYLISKCASVAFHDGNTADYIKYIDLLRQKMPEISKNQPELVEHIVFLNGLDFRLPLKRFIELLAESMPPLHLDSGFRRVAKTVTITQNLPFYHRSMRDYSEYYELKKEDFALIRATFGAMIGGDYDSMEHSIIAGIYYERGELLEAIRHAIEARQACGEGTHPETVFSADMILAATLYAMGALSEAAEIMRRTEDFIERQAQFLSPNFKALRTERAIRDGHTDAAREWLLVYANCSNRLPFYQICRHFATLRSYMAVKDYAAAAAFGARLSTLAAEYKRPLDQIESGLLTAMALWRGGEKKSAWQLEQAMDLARCYGFTQLFINEGKEILPLLWELRKRRGRPDAVRCFADRLINGIYKKHDLKPDEGTNPKLSEQQRAMLPYLSRGMTYKEIAEAAGLGHGTVKSHILLVYKRLGARNAREAVMKAKLLGLWDGPLD